MGFFDDDENEFWDFMKDTGALDEKKKEKQRKKNSSDKNEKAKVYLAGFKTKVHSTVECTFNFS